MCKLIEKIWTGFVILGLVWLLTGCAVVKQSCRFAGEGLSLVGTAANETAKAVQYAADSVNEPKESDK